MAKEVWRLVQEQAIRCTDCEKNRPQLGGDDICTADDEICVFLKKKIDQQKTWNDFHEAYHELGQHKYPGGDTDGDIILAAEEGGEAL